MNSQDSKQNWTKGFDASVVASLLLMGSSTAAQANPIAIPDLHAADSRAGMRAERHEMRQQLQEIRLENRATMMESRALRSTPNVPTATSVGIKPGVSNFHHIIHQENTAVLFPGQVSTFRTVRPNQGRSTYINDNGKSKIVSRGLSLDLSSTSANITVGDNLLTGSVTIKVGNQTREISAGSKVTAAEFAALNQKLATGDQALTLSARGAATGGTLNLNNVSDDGATIRASELVIPQNVSVTGDFARTADGVRVTSDIQNYGSLTATSSNANRNTAVIAARDINNQAGALISSGSTSTNPELNLALRADRDLNNLGNISSSGSLELTGGRSVNNAGGAVAEANGSVTINSPVITNYGSIASQNGDITLGTPTDAKLIVNNLGGNMSALNGAINVRAADYAGTADSIVYGGNLRSKDLNLNAGQGTATLTAEDVTGTVNSTGLAAHVNVNSETLVLGEQCLTGDPTYYNTGNIVISGNVIVGEDLAIIAGGDITTTVPSLGIRARDNSGNAFDINIIAGANITAGSGPIGDNGTLHNQSVSSISQNATAPVTINGASSTGGNIDLTGATIAMSIVASSTINGGAAGDITLAAFANSSGAKGQILTNVASTPSIDASGNGLGRSGDINIIAGATSGTAISLGDITTAGGPPGSSGPGGAINIVNAQPVSSDGGAITFATNGSISSGNRLVASNTLGGGSVSAIDLKSRSAITVKSGEATSLGDIDVSSTIVGAQAGSLNVESGSTIMVGLINASNTTTTGNAGSVTLKSNSSVPFSVGGGGTNGSGLITANAGTSSGNGGNVAVINGGTGGINVVALPSTNVTDGNGAGLTLNAGSGTLNLSILATPTITRNGVGTNRNGGTIFLEYGTLTIPSGNINLQANATGTGSGGTIVVHNNGGGITTGAANGEFTLSASGNFETGIIDLKSSGPLNFNTSTSIGALRRFESGSTITINQQIQAAEIQISAVGAVTVNQQLTAHPISIVSQGDIILNGSLLGNGGKLVVAGGNISTTTTGINIDATNVSGNGGNVVLAAGAAYTETANDVLITGASSTGGSLNFSVANSLQSIQTFSNVAGATGGDVTLLAFQGASVNSGRVALNSSSSINASGPAGSGTITVLANSSTGSAISLGSVLRGGGTTLGSIVINAATPVTATAGALSKADASYSGTFTGGALVGGSILTGNLNLGPGFLDVSTDGNLAIGNIGGFVPTNFNGPDATLRSGQAANFSVGTIDLFGSGTGNGGHLTITAGSGTTTIGNIQVTGGNMGVGGNGGSVSIEVNSANTLILPSNINVNGNGTGGSGGTIQVVNLGTGGIRLTSSLGASGPANGGNIIIDAGTGLLSSTTGIALFANAGSSAFANGNISVSAGSITTSFSGSFFAQANIGLSDTGNISVVTNGDVNTGGGSFNVSGKGDVLIDLSGGLINTSNNTAPGQVTITGRNVTATDVNINSDALTGNTNAAQVQITALNGDVSVGGISARPSGTSITGPIILSATNGDINVTGQVTSNGKGALTVNLTGASPGDATFTETNNSVDFITGTGGGTITFNNGTSPLRIGPLGATQSVVLATTSATGITVSGAPINTTGTIVLNTPTLSFNSPVQAASILVQNLAGSLTVTGGASATMTGTTPSAGSPGSPSTPAAITFATAAGANLNLFGNVTFSGDVLLSNPNGTTTSNTGSVLTGNNNITLKTETWTQQGGGNIIANRLIFAGQSIVNATGNVSLTNLTLAGRDVLIAAFGNIDVTGTISTASTTGNGGNITLLAGFTFAPETVGQTTTQTPYQITGFNPAGASITGTANLDSSSSFAGGNAGSITAIAHLGAVSLGSINASATSGAGGDVSIYGGNGVTTGDIDAAGSTTSGSVTASVSEVQIVGVPVIDSGTITSGSLVPTGVKETGTVTVGAITAGSFINLEALGNVTINGALSANSITVDTDKSGFLQLNGITSITATPDSGNDGGSIAIDISNFDANGGATLTLNANSGAGGDGGSISFTTTDVVNLGSFLLLNATGTNSGGTINVSTDYVISASGGLNAAGANGRGAVITLTAGQLIDISNTAFLSQIDGTGAAGDGGGVALIASSISTKGTAETPLALSAKGSGTGKGGSITFITTDPTTTYIGSNPAKAPKGFVNYITLDSRGGATGGAGGSVNVLSGGNVIVDPAAVLVGPQAANSNGGFITIESNNSNGKTGSLIVLGDLNANGTGIGTPGAITLRSDSKKAFTIGGTKTPKNGVMGSLTAGTLTGNVVVINNGGGVTVSAPNAITSGNVTLQAALKGSITEGKGVTISAGNTLTMTTDAGNIGKKPLLVNARNLVLNSNTGSANVLDVITGDINLSSTIGVGGDLSVQAQSGGITVLTNLITTSGDINLTASGSTLRVNAGLNVQANNGSLTLANLDTNGGDIVIQDGASVQTAGKGGQVVLAIGTPPKKGTTSATPANVNDSEIGKGQIFYGPDGTVVVPTGSADVVAMNKNVIFNNLSTGGKLITLGNGSLVKADPPLRGSAMPHSSSFAGVVETTAMSATPSTQMMTFPIANPLSNLNSIDLLATSNVRTASVTADTLGNYSSLLSIATVDTQAIHDTRNGINSLLMKTELSTNNVVPDSAVINLSSQPTTDSGEQDSNNLIIDAQFHTDKTGAQSFSPEKIAGVKMETIDTADGARDTVPSRHALSQGNVLFASSTATVVETAHGNVELAAGTIALIMHNENGLSVYDLHDQSKNAVVINTDGKRISLSPGRHAMVSKTAHNGFAYANPIELVQYRNIQEAKHNGSSVYTTEFAIPSICYAVKPLKQLMASNHREANAIAKRIIKTTAVLSTIAPDRGDFVQFFKSQRTAMVK